MSSLNKDGTTIYDHFNTSNPVSIPVDLDALALLLERTNYGTVRFLAALVRVRKVLHAKRIKSYEDRGDYDIADRVTADGDPISDAIEALLRAGEF